MGIERIHNNNNEGNSEHGEGDVLIILMMIYILY